MEFRANVILSSDFPTTANQAVVNQIQARDLNPQIACISPFTELGHKRFPSVKRKLESYNLPNAEYCDIDKNPNRVQLDNLGQYDTVYLSGGNPLGFRRSIQAAGIGPRLRAYLADGGLIVAASGGAMQLTANVSLFRLITESVDDVLRSHSKYEALGMVQYEILPHLNRLDPPFLEKVLRYSERVHHDVIALADGAAVLHSSLEDGLCIGKVVRFRFGEVTDIDTLKP